LEISATKKLYNRMRAFTLVGLTGVTVFFSGFYFFQEIRIAEIRRGGVQDGSLTISKFASEALTTVEIERPDGTIATARMLQAEVVDGVLTGNVKLETEDGELIEGRVIEFEPAKFEIEEGSITEGKLSKVFVARIEKLESGLEDFEQSSVTEIADGSISEGKLSTDVQDKINATVSTIEDGSILTVKLADNVITTSKLADGSVSASKLLNASISSGKLQDAIILTQHLGDGSISAVKIQDGAIASSKILDGAVTTVKLADGSVTTAKLVDGNITQGKIADGAIIEMKLADDSVSTDKIQDGAIAAAKIEDGAISNIKITDGAIHYSKLSNAMCAAGELLKKNGGNQWECAADGGAGVASVGAGNGLSNSGTISDPILDVNVDGTTIEIVTDVLQIRDLAITAVKLAGDAVTTLKILDGNVTEGKLHDGAVTEVKLADNSVISAKIVNGTIVDADISASAAIAYSKLNLTGEILLADLAQNGCVAGQILKWNGSAWACLADNDTDTVLSEAQVEGFIFDADNTGTLSSGTVALGSLTFTGELTDTNISNVLTIDATGSVADGALSVNVSLLGSGIEKNELVNSGVLGFAWTATELVSTVMVEGENISLLTNDSGYLTSFTETDPIFIAAPAAGIASADITNWNTTYGWGNHAVQGYITDGNTNWDNSYGFITASSTETLTNKSGNISMWTNDSGYLTSYTETDPTLTDNAAVTLGDGLTDMVLTFNSDAGIDGTLTYLGGTDTFSFNGALSATGYNNTNWNTAHGWGDHATQGYITDGNTNWDNSYGFITASSTETLTNKSGNISMWTNDSGYLTSYSETDPVWVGAESNYFNLTQNEIVTGIPAFNGGTSGATAPFSVDSTFLITNFNADLLDGQSGAYYLDNTDTQDLSIVGHTISLVNGGSVVVPDNYAANTDTQDLGVSGNSITLTNSPSITAPYATSAGNAATTDGYSLNQNVLTTSSPTFTGLTATSASHTVILSNTTSESAYPGVQIRKGTTANNDWWTMFVSGSSHDFIISNYDSGGGDKLRIENTSGYVHMPGGHGTDYAELFPIYKTAKPGNLVSLGVENVYSLSHSDSSNIGIISTKPATVAKPTGGFQIGWDTKEEYINEEAPIALAGRVPTIITGSSVGDSITSSSLPGVGMKATQAGPIVGKALESTEHWSEQTCPAVDSLDSINWPEDDGTNPAKPCFRLPDGTYVGKIMVFVNVSWYEPEDYLSKINQIISDYDEELFTGNMISIPSDLVVNSIQAQTGAFTQLSGEMLSIGNGSLEVDALGNVVTVGSITADKLFSNTLEVQELIAKENENIGVVLGDSEGLTKFVIKDSDGNSLIRVNSEGKVIIGSGKPGAALEVDGIIKTTPDTKPNVLWKMKVEFTTIVKTNIFMAAMGLIGRSWIKAVPS